MEASRHLGREALHALPLHTGHLLGDVEKGEETRIHSQSTFPDLQPPIPWGADMAGFQPPDARS